VTAVIKNLTAVGNSLGLIIERPILDLLDIDKETPLEVRTDGEVLIIRPQRRTRSARLKAAAKRMMEAHDDTLRKLAR
jgi:antitoxin MazE